MRTLKFTLPAPKRTEKVCPTCHVTEPEEECPDHWHLEEIEHELPACWAICTRCNGEGEHVNPSVDGHGITFDEWEEDWDDEGREMYLNGGYNVPCEAACKAGKVLVVDEHKCNAEPRKALLKRYNTMLSEQARERAADLRTLFFESGGTEGRY